MKRFAIAILVVAMSAATALAQGVDPDTAIAFLDKNQDGAVDLDEYIAWQQSRFETVDVNHNGHLSLVEFRDSLDARGKRNAEKSLYAFDIRGVGSLTATEFLRFHAYVFENILDRNRDGKWTVDEYRAYLQP